MSELDSLFGNPIQAIDAMINSTQKITESIDADTYNNALDKIIKDSNKSLDCAERNGAHDDMRYWSAYIDGVYGLAREVWKTANR